MPGEPQRVEIRGYQVGFGDCFLLSFIYKENDQRHVLIDFGTTELPPRGDPPAPAKPSEYMPEIARQIAKQCNGKLTAVVATHRHADHISGFGTDGKTGHSGETIRDLRPQVILQPWTEDPAAARDAHSATRGSSRSPKSFVAGLDAMHRVAQAVVELTESPPPAMAPAVAKELRFLGLDNIANESAVRNLIAMGQAPGAAAYWAHHGSPSGLDPLLPGVRVHVLGPPDLTQTGKIKAMRAHDPDQFWFSFSGLNDAVAGLASGQRQNGRKPRLPSIPPDARWFRDRLDHIQAEQLLEIVRILDDQMNNTSLILLFEVFGKKLLFPGDAQIENWSYALRDAPNAQDTRALLAGVDVYKVGHHGSLNATPKTMLWENFSKRNPASSDKRLKTLLSTLPGKHGAVSRQTEVPRSTLLAALERESSLSNTNALKFGADGEVCYTVVVEP